MKFNRVVSGNINSILVVELHGISGVMAGLASFLEISLIEHCPTILKLISN